MQTVNIRNPYAFAVTLIAIFILVGAIAGGLGFISGLSVLAQVAIDEGTLAVIGIVLLQSSRMVGESRVYPAYPGP